MCLKLLKNIYDFVLTKRMPQPLYQLLKLKTSLILFHLDPRSVDPEPGQGLRHHLGL